MFAKRIWRYKWPVLAPFDQALGKLVFADATGRHEKTYFYEPSAQSGYPPFCVSVGYAALDWHRTVVPAPKAKATLLIVRPHLFRSWPLPLSSAADTEQLTFRRLVDRMPDPARSFVEMREDAGHLTVSVGLEFALSADDIERDPDGPCRAWIDCLNVMAFPPHNAAARFG